MKFRSIAAMVILIFLAHIGRGQQSDAHATNINKLLKYFGNQQDSLRKQQDCPDCSHIVAFKLYFNNRKLIKVVPSYSMPPSLKYIPNDLVALEIDWGFLLENAPTGTTKFILPVFFMVDRKGGALFPSVSSVSKDIFEFEDGGLFDINKNTRQFHIAPPMYLNSSMGLPPVPSTKE